MTGGSRRWAVGRWRGAVGEGGWAKSQLAKNAGSLYAIQLGSYVLPIASFPYLTRVLGPERYGVYVLVLAVARYGLIVTDWGFNYSATRELSTRGREPGASAIYSATVTARACLLACCALVLVVLTTTVPKFQSNAGFYWLGFCGVAGSAFLPVWLYQAFEKVSFVAGTLFLSRLVTTVLIFMLVHGGNDVGRLVALWSAPWILTAAVALAFAPRLFGTSLHRPAARSVFDALRGGSHLFASQFAATLYTALSAVMLGLISNDREVGYFGAAETLVIAAVGLIGPLSQALFPSAARAGAAGRDEAERHFAHVYRPIAALGATLSLGAFALAPLIGQIVVGSAFDRSIRVLQVMSPIPLAVAVSTALVTQLMLPLRMDRAYTASVFVGACLCLALTAALVPSFGAVGTAIAVTSAELCVCAGVCVVLSRHGFRVRSLLLGVGGQPTGG